MSRTADYTIQGFLYQFHKTLLEILKEPLEASVSIEGIIEDVEVMHSGITKAIQCKYHESVEQYTLSQVYKPILQMMEHFYDSGNKYKGIKYILYAYFPNQVGKEVKLTDEHLQTILSTTNDKFLKKAQKLKGKVNIEVFLENFEFESGESMENMKKSIFKSFSDLDFGSEYIDSLLYPNAINIIAETSTFHNKEERIVKIGDFLKELQQIKNTALSKWTIALKNYKTLLNSRRKQLKVNLDQNSRLRYFIIKEDFIEDFDDNIVTLIKEYLEKYHFKFVHDKTPLFCLDCSTKKFHEILVRLYQKSIKVNHGLIATDFFEETHFFKVPLIKYNKNKIASREFDIRVLHIEKHEILNRHKADDLFVLSDSNYSLDSTDVNYEKIELNDINAIKYILGMRDTYE